MRITPALGIILCAFLFLLPSCDRETAEIETEKPLLETAAAQSDPNTIVLKDQSGATLTLDLGGRLDAFLSAGTTTDFSAPVRIRFQGGEADTNFRKSTEMGQDEEDYWDFDEEKGHFKVGWTIAFLRSLAEADRLFLEIKLSDQEIKALVFGLSETQRSAVLAKLEDNQTRVDNEMRALGLGPYAPKAEPGEGNPDHLKIEIDDEALYVLYDEYIILLARLTRENVFPSPTPHDNQAIEAKTDFIRPVTSAFSYYAKAYPEAMAAGERMALDAGFETGDQWKSIGDRLHMGMIIVGIEEVTPGFIIQNLNYTPEELTSFTEKKRKYTEVLRAFGEDELKWFTENRPRFQKALGN